MNKLLLVFLFTASLVSAAALSQTASSVVPSASAVKDPSSNAAVAIAAGQPICRNSSGAWVLADADDITLAATHVAGNTAGIGQPVVAISQDGDFTHGLSGVVAGDILLLHTTAGSFTITPGDLGTTKVSQVIGIAKSATKAVIMIVPGQVKP